MHAWGGQRSIAFLSCCTSWQHWWRNLLVWIPLSIQNPRRWRLGGDQEYSQKERPQCPCAAHASDKREHPGFRYYSHASTTTKSRRGNNFAEKTIPWSRHVKVVLSRQTYPYSFQSNDFLLLVLAHFNILKHLKTMSKTSTRIMKACSSTDIKNISKQWNICFLSRDKRG